MNKFEQSFFAYAALGYLADLNHHEIGSLVWWSLALLSCIASLFYKGEDNGKA